MKKEKGSLAIEATISFTVFLCFMFVLMTIVKLSMVYITLNDVTSETVKKVAGMSYPLSYVNDFVNDEAAKANNFVDEKKKSITDLANENGVESILQELGFDGGIESIIGSAEDILGDFTNKILSKLEEFKINKQTELAANIYSKLLDDTSMPIDKSKVNVKYFTLPQSNAEFEYSKSIAANLTNLEENKLDKDDVILAVEYDYTITVPFFPAYDVKLKSMAVEKAWLYGGNHVVPAKREGIKVDVVESKIVYYTNTGKGKKYHRENCMTLIRSEKNGNKRFTSEVLAAKKKGLQPCLVCKPDDDEKN